MSLKLFLLLLLGLVLLTTSTLADYGSRHPPRGGGQYGGRPPKYGPPHSTEDSLSDENLPLDGRGGYQRPPYKKKPPVEEMEGKGKDGGRYDEPEPKPSPRDGGRYDEPKPRPRDGGRYDEPKPRPRHEPIYEDPRKGDGPKKPPHA